MDKVGMERRASALMALLGMELRILAFHTVVAAGARTVSNKRGPLARAIPFT